MKNALFFLFLSFILLQCKKDSGQDSIPDPPVHVPVLPLGQAGVLKNGVAWEVPFDAWYHADTHERCQLRAKILYPNLISESLFLEDIPCKEGVYPVEYYTSSNFRNYIPDVFFTMISEFDQPIGDFKIDTMRNDHYVEVLRYDSVAHTIEGRFQMFLKKRQMTLQWPGVPDSIYFTEGKFHLQLEDP
ncbi:MAG: hypothetical protein H6575_17310 [Lewinellaceae bacterium]|nr:hypothetical protein [Lewinellaceae bacterium]